MPKRMASRLAIDRERICCVSRKKIIYEGIREHINSGKD